MEPIRHILLITAGATISIVAVDSVINLYAYHRFTGNCHRQFGNQQSTSTTTTKTITTINNKQIDTSIQLTNVRALWLLNYIPLKTINTRHTQCILYIHLMFVVVS